SGGPRRVRRAVLLLAPQLAAGGRSVRLDGGAPARNLRLHGGPAIFVARGIGSASLLGSRPDRNDRSARGQARARSGDLLRAGGAGPRLRLLAPASGGAGKGGAAQRYHRDPQTRAPPRTGFDRPRAASGRRAPGKLPLPVGARARHLV